MRIALGIVGIGLGSLGTLDAFADAIQTVEGYFAPGQNPLYPSGTLAWRNNNPGNLRYDSYYVQAFGAVPGVGGYLIFPSYEIGRAALEHQIQVDASRGLTIAQMMKKYAPAQDGNDPLSYASTIAHSLGVTVDTPVILAIAPASPGGIGPIDLPNGGEVSYAPVLLAAGLAALLILAV